MYRIHIFGTGSKGNSALVSDGETKILIDAGISPSVIQEFTPITQIDAVLLTHEHGDHSRFARALYQHFAREIYATAGTIMKLNSPTRFTQLIRFGVLFCIGAILITPFPLSHDAAEPCGFFIRNALGETLVWASDTGTMDGLQMAQPADCYVLEANYDENTIDDKLERGELPYAGLHGRLTSEFGHLSVQQTAAWLNENAGPNSRCIVLTPHAEIIEPNRHLFDGLNAVFPAAFPFQFEFGKKCPF